ncbi:MAG: hypothetical protein ACLQPD_08465 [Desulfomonilaceae bacterium]
MNLQVPDRERDSAVHGALLRLLNGPPEEFPGVSESVSLQYPQQTPDPELKQVQPLQSRCLWSEVPMVEMIRLELRPRVDEILRHDSNAYCIIQACKLGVIDRWEAMERTLVLQ